MKARSMDRLSSCCMGFRNSIRAGTPLSHGSPLGGIGAWHLTSGATLAVRGRRVAGITGCPNWSRTSARSSTPAVRSGAPRRARLGCHGGMGRCGRDPRVPRSLTTMSVPHPAAFLKAMATSRQALASWYIYFFQLPRIPERYFLGRERNASGLSMFMQSRAKQPSEAADRDAQVMAEPGVSPPHSTGIARSFCRTFAASERRSLSPRCMCGATATPPYSKRVPATAGVTLAASTASRPCGSHWMLDEQPDAIADLLLEWFAGHPI